MKKVLFTLSLLVVSFAFVACSDNDDNKAILPKDLPANVQVFLQNHFPTKEVRYAKKNNDSYDVYMENGFEIEFTLSGEWDSIEGRGQKMPESIVELLPVGIPTYVAENYPNQFIVEINKENFGYEIDLNNRIELEFDKDGVFLRIDR